MADQKTNKDILEIVSELPKDLRDAYFSPATTEAIKETGKNNGLTIDKIGELAHETGLVMIGITPPGEYIKNLTGRLGVAPEKAKAVAEEINQKVFQPVRESLKKIHGLGAPPSTLGVETPKTPSVFPGAKPIPPAQKPLPALESQPKPLPKREEIKMPPKLAPPPNLPVETKSIPSIFVKNIPSSSTLGVEAPKTPSVFPRTESEKLKSELEGALNKENQKPPPAGGYQSKDPYREPTE